MPKKNKPPLSTESTLVAPAAKNLSIDKAMVLATQHQAAGQLQQAEHVLRQILQRQPTHAHALHLLGVIAHQCGKPELAIELIGQAIASNDRVALFHTNRGEMCRQLKRLDEAIEHGQRAVALEPGMPAAHSNLGIAYFDKNDYVHAEACQQQALALQPVLPAALNNMGSICRERKQLDDAADYYRRAIAAAPHYAEPLSNLGSVLNEERRHDEAMVLFNQALAIDPQLTGALLGKGRLYMEDGRLEDAEALFRQALAINPDELGARFHLSQVKKVRKGDENMAALVAMGKGLDRMPWRKATQLHYALGKCYDDIGEPARAFPHFLEAARLERQQISYDPAANTKFFDDIMSLFDAPTMERLRGHGNDDAAPIFVLGMPRSGTTLTEQIIASHPDVHGAGELRELLAIAHRQTIINDNAADFPANLKNLSGEHLAAWGGDYLASLRGYAPTARRITDKMPTNFFMTGLIHLMLPNAKIVHVSRHPLDTCLSCFARSFSKGQDHTYDLAELGRYYVNYTRIMEHWRKVIPEHAFLDVRYEELVTDNEAQARRLIDFCGLEWDTACLQSHKTKRPVRTDSVTQVREPIYTSSVGRWRRYEPFLAPLISELGDLI